MLVSTSVPPGAMQSPPRSAQAPSLALTAPRGEHGAPAALSGDETRHCPACEFHPGSPKQNFTSSPQPRTCQAARPGSALPNEAKAGRVPVPQAPHPRSAAAPTAQPGSGAAPHTQQLSPLATQAPNRTGAGSTPSLAAELRTLPRQSDPAPPPCWEDPREAQPPGHGRSPSRPGPARPRGLAAVPTAPHSPRRCGRSQPGAAEPPARPSPPSAGPLCPVTGATGAGPGPGWAGPAAGTAPRPRARLPGDPGRAGGGG